MKHAESKSNPLSAVIGGAVVLLILLGLFGTCDTEPDVNTELARTARTAVESAETARRNNDAAYLWPGRLRMLAICVGVAVPVAAAVVLVWICLRHRPGDLELIALLDEQRRTLEAKEIRRLPGSRPSADLSAANVRQPKRVTNGRRRRRRKRPKTPRK